MNGCEKIITIKHVCARQSRDMCQFFESWGNNDLVCHHVNGDTCTNPEAIEAAERSADDELEEVPPEGKAER